MPVCIKEGHVSNQYAWCYQVRSCASNRIMLATSMPGVHQTGSWCATSRVILSSLYAQCVPNRFMLATRVQCASNMSMPGVHSLIEAVGIK